MTNQTISATLKGAEEFILAYYRHTAISNPATDPMAAFDRAKSTYQSFRPENPAEVAGQLSLYSQNWISRLPSPVYQAEAHHQQAFSAYHLLLNEVVDLVRKEREAQPPRVGPLGAAGLLGGLPKVHDDSALSVYSKVTSMGEQGWSNIAPLYRNLATVAKEGIERAIELDGSRERSINLRGDIDKMYRRMQGERLPIM